jgi:hypothetical protein
MTTSWRHGHGFQVETVEDLHLTKDDLRNLQRLMKLRRHSPRQRQAVLCSVLSRALADECRETFEDEEVPPFPGRVPSDW